MVRVILTLLLALPLLQPPGLCLCQLLAQDKDTPALVDRHACCSDCEHEHDADSTNESTTPERTDPCGHEPGCPAIAMVGSFLSFENARGTIESCCDLTVAAPMIFVEASPPSFHLQPPPPLFAAVPSYLTHRALLL